MKPSKNTSAIRLQIKEIKNRFLYEFRHRYYIFFIVTIIALIIDQIFLWGTDISGWDPLFISTIITFIIGIRLAINLPQIVNETLMRLINRGTLEITSQNKLNEFNKDLDVQTAKYAHRIGLFFAIAIIFAWLVVFNNSHGFRLSEWLTLVLETFVGYVIGRSLGYAISYGGLKKLLDQHNISIKVQPGHLDGVAGLKPIGDLYFFQATLIAFPAVYLAIWWFIFPLFPRYALWRDPYIGLLTIILIIEFLAFFLPIWSFHTEMHNQKNKLLNEADKLSQDIIKLQSKLVSTKSESERNNYKDRLALMTQQYWDLEIMPTWPVDIRVQRKFTLSNLGLLVPLFANFLNTELQAGDKLWERVGKVIVSFFQ